MKVQEIHDAVDHISEQAMADTAAKLIAPGAVLIVVRGMILAHTVPTALLRAPAAINQDMKALVAKSVLPAYLCAFLRSHNQRLLSLVEKSTHDTRKLPTAALLRLQIPLPSLGDQHELLTRVAAIEARANALGRLHTEVTEELDTLPAAVLEHAFVGRL
jgi:type I restriction enzyme S subunit